MIDCGMRIRRHLWLTLLLAATLPGCNKPARDSAVEATPIPEPVAKTNTLETRRLGGAIDAYEQMPNAVTSSAVKKTMADLDGEIAELEARAAKTSGSEKDEAEMKRRNLTEYRDTQKARFELLQVKGSVGVAREPATDARSAEQKARDAAKDVGDKVEAGAKRAGDTLEKAGQNAKDAIREIGR